MTTKDYTEEFDARVQRCLDAGDEDGLAELVARAESELPDDVRASLDAAYASACTLDRVAGEGGGS